MMRGRLRENANTHRIPSESLSLSPEFERGESSLQDAVQYIVVVVGGILPKRCLTNCILEALLADVEILILIWQIYCVLL